MAYVFSGKNCFKWPEKDDIIAVIDPRVPINPNFFRINENQFADLEQEH